PASRGTSLFSGFLQGDVRLADDRLHLSAGTKLEHSAYTGFEYQPGARLLWTPTPRQVLWLAASQALRTPARADQDVRLNLLAVAADSLFPGSPLALGTGFGSRDFRSERLRAFELGYRARPADPLLLDVATFYNRYLDLRAGEPALPYLETEPEPAHLVAPFYAANLATATTYGLELAADWRLAADRLRLRAAYSLLQLDIHLAPGADPRSASPEGESPEHQLYLWSALTPRPDLQLDAVLRHVAALPSLDTDAYTVVDARAAWEPVPRLELSLVARNLLSRHHPEFRAFFVDTIPTQTQHEIVLALRWRT
ncbi:MAG: TonB-dependent receptor, partial [Gemmatimonadota bacterium]